MHIRPGTAPAARAVSWMPPASTKERKPLAPDTVQRRDSMEEV
jgi:hypothetical protein